MRKRVFFLIIVYIACIIILTGCWDYREVNNLSIVAGVAIDKSDDGKYKITTEIVDMHEGGKDVKIKSKRLESYGDTFFDAIRNVLKINSEKLYWGHTEIVIISQDVAKQGIYEILDFLNRDAEPRLSIDLLVSKQKTAEEILDSESITTEIRSFEISRMLDQQRILAKAPKVQIYEFINSLSNEGISPIIPTIGIVENEGKNTSELSGTAIFEQDKIVGFLDEDETRTLMYIMDKIKGGILNIKQRPETAGKNVSLLISENKTKIKPINSNNNIFINIELETETALGEVGSRDNINTEDKISTLEKEAEELLTTNIINLIEKVQKDFEIDIFGFGKTIKEDMPDLWKKIGPDWNNSFKKVKVNVNTSVDIQNTGLMSKNIKMGD